MDTEFFDEDSLYRWEFKNKSYPHFDVDYCENRVDKVISDLKTKQKMQHSFYPLIRFEKPKFKRDEKGRLYKSNKPRYLMHTARIDSNIYSFYRNILMNQYENTLKKFQISDNVISYRRIPISDNSKKNKCNIHFANEAIEEIKERTIRNDSCVAITLDISGFFDNLDHNVIKKQWCLIMGFKEGLPDDHYCIYKNITRFKYIEASALENILGTSLKRLRIAKGRQICSPKYFRSRIVPHLSTTNKIGIPQGTTISDVIANMYMIEFDILVKRVCEKYGAYYRRYSDDILIICNAELEKQAINFIKHALHNKTKTLEISNHKTLITRFHLTRSEICYNSYNTDAKIDKPFEYLGLSYDGKYKNIRRSTISRFYGKLSKRIKVEVNIAYEKLQARGNITPNSDEIFKIISFDLIRDNYMENRQDENSDDFVGNFYTYMQLASQVTENKEIIQFFNKLGDWIKKRARKYCDDKVKHHFNPFKSELKGTLGHP